ncbi:MAG: putative transposase [Candidatus Latescibacterota bacterium]|jgi:putative transposase
MYPSDLGDAERQLIEPLFNDRIRVAVEVNMPNAAIINAILYVVYGGIQWRILPKEFPPWGTIYDHFRRLNQSGVWQQILDALTQQSRRRQGRHLHPSYAIIDSQSVKTQYASDERGIDSQSIKTP